MRIDTCGAGAAVSGSSPCRKAVAVLIEAGTEKAWPVTSLTPGSPRGLRKTGSNIGGVGGGVGGGGAVLLLQQQGGAVELNLNLADPSWWSSSSGTLEEMLPSNRLIDVRFASEELCCDWPPNRKWKTSPSQRMQMPDYQRTLPSSSDDSSVTGQTG
ncbi:hypothetical protein EYF80_016178 [Liparis tanakae]|uniref:Uncharacterized protein n=1 Tax=Liparis tanakae TaxID=230148 RepID=A0A4Z2I8Z5_9TELE|nr:hypothetical protein EYF80_016178 [Liparis tanakae]